MSKIPLIHPIYLDVPMLVSFAAAIRGGVAMETELTEHEESKQATSGKLSGKLGFSKIFQSLFDASIDSSLESKRDTDFGQSRKESKAHTESSIAILLYHDLVQDGGYILSPKGIDDVKNYSPGSLVEIGGTVEKNAVDQMIEYIDAANILSGFSSAPKQQNPGESKHRNRNSDQSPNLNAQLELMRNALDADRKRTPLSNIVVRCTQPAGVNVVATLRTANLRDLTLSELHKNSVRVIGKITRVLPAGDSMSSFENSALSMVPPHLLNGVFAELKNSIGMVTPLSDIEVVGPAWQILPLMIFV